MSENGPPPEGWEVFGTHAGDEPVPLNILFSDERDEAGMPLYERVIDPTLLSWNQNICEACWFEKNPDRFPKTGKREDTDNTVDRCSYCGGFTVSRIYVRDDPESVEIQFPRLKEDD